ncbi:hypothetical protein GQ457_02G017100 [Hibiscus cannabinus]
MLMPDKSSAMVHTQYLQFLTLPWEVGSYSWGSVILAFLYREMCKASKMSNVDGRALNADIGGCMVLLQSWAWYRMSFLAPICAAPTELSLATRHVVRKPAYLDDDLFVLTPERAYEDAENWCSVMPLIHFALVEMFYGDRVLRQFGYHQPVPNMPLNMDVYEQIDTRGKSDTNWSMKHAHYIELWNARETSRPRCDPLTTDDFDLSSSVYHYWLLQNSKLILTTQAEREAWLLIFPSSGLRRGSSGSGSSSSVVGGSSRRSGSGAGGRGRRARRAAAEPEPEYAPQMEEADVTPDLSELQFFDTQPVGVDYMTSVMATTSLSSPLVSTGVGGAGPSMFRTPRRMNVESEEDNDDEDSGQVRGGVADDDNDDDVDDGDRGAEA